MSQTTEATTIPGIAGSRTTVGATVPRGDHYTGAELLPFAGRPGATDALALPSRMGNRLHFRDGQVGTV